VRPRSRLAPQEPLRPVPRPPGGHSRGRSAPQAASAPAVRLHVRAGARSRPRAGVPVRSGPDLRRAVPGANERGRLSRARGAGGDQRWLSAWLHAPRRQGTYIVVDANEDPRDLARKISLVTDVVT